MLAGSGVPSGGNHPSSITNNRRHVLEQLAANNATGAGAANQPNTGSRQSSGSAIHTGFEYAVQPDGSNMLEEHWVEHRRNPQYQCFTLHPPQGTANRIRSITEIEQKVQQARSRYRQLQQENAPPPPPPPPPPPQPQQPASSYSNATQSSRPATGPSATYGTDSPATANSVGVAVPNSRTTYNNNASFSGQNAPMASTSARGNSTTDDDEYDAIFASIDLDQISSVYPDSTSRPIHQPQSMSGTGAPSPATMNQNPYGRPQSQATSNIASNSFGPNRNGGTVQDIVEPFRPAVSDRMDNQSSNYGISRPTTTNASLGTGWTSNNSTSQYIAAGRSFDDANGYDDSWAPMGSSDGGEPCCSGHNLPCIKLTARSDANNGRQFYKCSVQDEEQNCKFFQWVDGVDGNWNNSIEITALSYAPGDVKDAVTESRRVFGHRSFRPGQGEVIAQAIAGKDVFVLMPTGGGKSLCYQLPAWCCPGLAVVVSPLLSLIQDQVHSMTKLGVQSVFLASSQDYQSEQMDITRRLNAVTAHGGVKLLYLTPEKLNNSPMIQGLLRRLHQKKMLSRFVVDEAHSMSDWGHDFRPDYSKLGVLRQEYPGVPLMALTATANEKVVGDAIRALGMRDVYRYTSSFNRPNLRYEVRKKDGKTIEAIADYISKRPSESGVIYCLSRKDCETLAEKLQEVVRSKPKCSRIIVSFYHADLDAHERERRHSDWSNGVISVLCATIAFGMGIDKPDVRYVIHNSMPKSITHYYQESGRAGRDGDKADCILYYNYGDKKILEGMIVKSSNDPNGEATRRKIDQLYSCVRYCEEEFQCRRTLQLDFFGEKFDRSKCNNTCDNCRAQRTPDRRDLTDVALAIVRLFNEAANQKRGTRLTLVQLVDLYRGSKSKAATKNLDTSRLSDYGGGSKYSKHEVDRIAHAMVFERILVESSFENKGGFLSDYVELAENAGSIQNRTRKFYVDFPTRTKSAETANTSKRKSTKKANGAASKASKKVQPISLLDDKARSDDVASELLTVDEISSDDDNLKLDDKSISSGQRAKAQLLSVLPQEKTKVLLSRIKKMATNWAEEERMYGKHLFYWNILSNDAMKSIAAQAPMTVEDLKAIGVLGESIINDYGDRIVKIVSSFVDQEELREYIAHRPAAKRPKLANGSSATKSHDVVEVPDDDEGSSMDIPAPGSEDKDSVTASRHFRS